MYERLDYREYTDWVIVMQSLVGIPDDTEFWCVEQKKN